MTTEDMLKKIRSVYGFSEAPANIWAWFGTIVFVVVSLTIFFLSYSLARHKRMVARLKAVVIQKEAELKVEKINRHKAELQVKLKHLEKADGTHKKERAAVRAKIANSDKHLKTAKKKLRKDVSKLSKKSIKDLLTEADRLLKDTL